MSLLFHKKGRGIAWSVLACFFLILSCTTSHAAGLVKTLSDIPTLPIVLAFKNQKQEALGGDLHVRVSFWKEKNVVSSQVENGILRYDSPVFLNFVEEQNLQADDQGIGTFFLGRFASFSLPQDAQIYAQIEYKRPSDEESLYMVYDGNTVEEGIQRLPLTTKDLQVVFGQSYESLEGYMLEKDGTPSVQPMLLRTSLWEKASFDGMGDRLLDGTLRQMSASYVGAEVSKVVYPDARGYFSVPVGKLAAVGALYTQKDIFFQVELKKANDLTGTYELMRPRGGGDRYAVVDGKIQASGAHGAAHELSNTLFVQQMPSGSSSTSFEIGVGNKNPSAMIDLIANQGADHNAVLRFNGEKKKWQVSTDGLVFEDIATWDGYLAGTKNPRFTIGMGDLSKSTWELAFGGGNNPGIIAYNALANTFSFSGDVDMQQHELLNAVLENRSTPPENPVKGQQYFNIREAMAYFYDGSMWQKMGGSDSYVYIGGGGSTSSTSTTTIVNGNSNSTSSLTYTINDTNMAADTTLRFGTDIGQYLKWNETTSLFELGKGIDIAGSVGLGTTLTLDSKNTSTPNDVRIIAEQGTNPDGELRYNASAGKWEIQNAGGLFSDIADVSSIQTLQNKTIDGTQNTITNIPWTALTARTKTMSFSPEYPGMSISKDGSNNKGILSSEKDTLTGKNYYEWTTSQAVLQDIDLALSFTLPDDFVSFQATPFTFEYKTTSSLPTESKLDFILTDATLMLVALTGSTDLTSSLAGQWQSAAVNFTGSPVFSAGDTLYVTVKASAITGSKAMAGTLTVHYNGR